MECRRAVEFEMGPKPMSQRRDPSTGSGQATGTWVFVELGGGADAAEFFHDRDFFFIDALDAVAHGRFAQADVAD